LIILSERGELVVAAASPEGFKPLARAQVLVAVTQSTELGTVYSVDEIAALVDRYDGAADRQSRVCDRRDFKSGRIHWDRPWER
jgi:hypothetical protein